MPKPVIWTVDDDPDVLRAVERDLRRQYGDRYKVISADSGNSALEGVKQLKLRNEPVALFLVDQRMPGLSGVEFLEKAIEFYPEAKRALLTAYADTDAAIRAINSVHIDHYLMKPWDPPEERLYGTVDDLLDDWQAGYHPVFEGVRVIGNRWSPRSSEIRDFLGRNFVPHQWLNIETDEMAKQLLTTANLGVSSLPAVVLADGSFLSNPTIAEVARKLGLKTKAEFPFYDLVVVGAGPAGLAAAVYGAADGLHTLLIEREAPGGQAGRSSRIENYLGFPVGLSGGDLARRAIAQARRFGVEILAPQEGKGVRVEGPTRVLTLEDGVEIGCRALLIAFHSESLSGKLQTCRGWTGFREPVFITMRPCPMRFRIGMGTFTSSEQPTQRARRPCIFPNSPDKSRCLSGANACRKACRSTLRIKLPPLKISP